MTCEIQWFIPNRAIDIRYTGGFTLESIIDGIKTALPWLYEIDGTPHCLCDVTPVDFKAFQIKALDSYPERDEFYERLGHGYLVYIGQKDNPFFQFVTATIAQQRGIRIRWFDNRPEAEAFITEIVEAIP